MGCVLLDDRHPVVVVVVVVDVHKVLCRYFVGEVPCIGYYKCRNPRTNCTVFCLCMDIVDDNSRMVLHRVLLGGNLVLNLN